MLSLCHILSGLDNGRKEWLVVFLLLEKLDKVSKGAHNVIHRLLILNRGTL